jgi:two-component system NtrC family sensor kinase
MSTDLPNRRILVVDDNPSIHHDFLKILRSETGQEALEEARAALFGESRSVQSREPFEVDCAGQGQVGLALL